MSPQTGSSHLQLVVTSNSSTSRSPSTASRTTESSGSDASCRNVDTGLRGRRRAGTLAILGTKKLEDESDCDFYLGDIYACYNKPFDNILNTQAEINDREVIGQYHQRIRDISRGWYHLRYLADFMTISTVPLRAKDLTTDMREERLNRVKISVIECGDELSTQELSTPRQLDTFLASVVQPQEAMKPRLLVVQDLSTLMIEKLGIAFDIEPGFFRSHIGHYVWLNTRDPQAEIPDLEAFSACSNYFSVQYASPRYFENQTQLKEAKAQVESFNVLRSIDHDGAFKDWSDKKGCDVGLVRNKVSLWVRPKTDPAQAWLGILLVDPTIMNNGFPLWSGYGNFHPPPSIHTPLEEVVFPEHGTNVQQFIFWTLNQARSKQRTPPPNPGLLPIAFFTMICSQWILMCEYINTRLGQIEYETELGLANLDSEGFDHTLRTLLRWRKRLPVFHEFVSRSISRISVRYTSIESAGPFDSWTSIIVNLKDILHRLNVLQSRAEKIMAVAVAVNAREESKKATQESHAITRVSYLAFIFVPLSFLASFFSMGETFPTKTYWVYAIVAIPISACAIVILIFAGSIGRWWGKIRMKKGKCSSNGAV